MIRAVLFDLDGVVRHFDPVQATRLESRHGLPSNAIASAAFALPLLERVTTGTITREEWIALVGRKIDNVEAAAEWGAISSIIDERMLQLSESLRSSGIRTGILTNGTDATPVELREQRVDRHFDAIFNSAEIGFTKPDARIFQHVLDAWRLSPHEAFFTDDSISKVAGAARLGMRTHHYAGYDSLRNALRTCGALLPAR